VAPATDAEAAHPLPIPADGLTLGRHVAWTPDRLVIVAERAGHIVLRHTTLCVEETLDVVDDLGAHAGAVDFPGPVLVRKSILDGVSLAATGEITVHGSIEAATIRGEADVTVHHGICGKEQGRVTARGTVRARFASNAHIAAGADVQIKNEVANSHIDCGGAFLGDGASVLSGEVTARRGITCDTAGSEAGLRVVLDLGLPDADLQRLGKLADRFKSLQHLAHHVRSTVEPLMQDPRRLTPAQKEKATELLFSATEAEGNAAEALRALEGPWQQVETAKKAAIVIKGMLYTGVTLRIGGVEAAVHKVLRGPLKAVREDAPGAPGIALFDGHNRRVATLPATAVAGYAAILAAFAAH
jgi:uncharacterized protein (DUF342 family)